MNELMYENIIWTLKQVATLATDAKKKPSEKQRMYYKAAFFSVASTTEALAHLIAKNFYDNDNKKEGIYPNETTYTNLHTLPSKLFSGADESATIGIFKKEEKPFTWKNATNFKTINQIIKNNNLCSEELCASLEKIRKKRNRVHIQSLEKTDSQYTREHIESTLLIIMELLQLYRSMHENIT